jgi:hypothetical protein
MTGSPYLLSRHLPVVLSTLRRLRLGQHTMSALASNAPAETIVANDRQQVRVVFRMKTGEEIEYTPDEEPHALRPALGGEGYMPLALGQRLPLADQLPDIEIVRKLGWGETSSVWLGRMRWEDEALEDNKTYVSSLVVEVSSDAGFTAECFSTLSRC